MVSVRTSTGLLENVPSVLEFSDLTKDQQISMSTVNPRLIRGNCFK